MVEDESEEEKEGGSRVARLMEELRKRGRRPGAWYMFKRLKKVLWTNVVLTIVVNTGQMTKDIVTVTEGFPKTMPSQRSTDGNLYILGLGRERKYCFLSLISYSYLHISSPSPSALLYAVSDGLFFSSFFFLQFYIVSESFQYLQAFSTVECKRVSERNLTILLKLMQGRNIDPGRKKNYSIRWVPNCHRSAFQPPPYNMVAVNE